MCSLIILALKQLRPAKTAMHVLYYCIFKRILKPSELQDHFNNRNGWANVFGHDIESLKPKRIHLESRATLPILGFKSAGKPLLMTSYHMAHNVAETKKPHTIAEELTKSCA